MEKKCIDYPEYSKLTVSDIETEIEQYYKTAGPPNEEFEKKMSCIFAHAINNKNKNLIETFLKIKEPLISEMDETTIFELPRRKSLVNTIAPVSIRNLHLILNALETKGGKTRRRRRRKTRRTRQTSNKIRRLHSFRIRLS